MTWVLLIFLIVCSATVSGSETALFALSRQDLYAFQASGSRLRHAAAALMHRPRRVLLSVLIANTAVNVAFFAVTFVTAKNIRVEHPFLAPLSGFAGLFAVILFGEIIPKSVALNYPRTIAPLVSPLLRGLQFVLAPLLWVLTVGLVEPVTRILMPAHVGGDPVSTDELRLLIQQSSHREVFSSVENDMLQAVIGLSDVSVRSIMVPRVDIIAAGVGDDPAAIRSTIAQSRKTKIPIYDRGLDDVQGLLYARDLHLHPDRPLARLVRPIGFVPEQANLIQVIRHFRETHTQLALVVDEYGGVAGLVSLEDVLEVIVGDLPGGDHSEPPLAETIDQNTYRLSGRFRVREWASLFGITAADKQVDTLGGLVTARLGRFPRVGDSVRTGNLTLTVESMHGRRVHRLLLKRDGGPPTPTGGTTSG